MRTARMFFKKRKKKALYYDIIIMTHMYRYIKTKREYLNKE